MTFSGATRVRLAAAVLRERLRPGGSLGGLSREQMAVRFARSTPPHAVRRWPLPRVKSEAIEALRAGLSGADPAQRDALLAAFRTRLEREGTPLVESDAPGWCRVSFVWIGEAAHGVVLQLNRVTDPLDIEDTRLERIADSAVHALTLRVPDTWQGSYLFAVMPYRVAPTLHARVDTRALMDFARGAQADPFARERIPSKAVTASGGLRIPDYAA
ncbi:enterochelin esterase domain-containing protein, partial [Microbacterium sp.]|uniref:enterochelin esterase domain-containing protein n=1 Tax=Microbacterium sp. TaxID=51671 RepID=UPI003C71A4F3